MFEVKDVVDKDSSLISIAYYDGKDVAIDFDSNSSDYYVYRNVPVEVWNAFKNATSLGQFYNWYIKGQYPCDVLHFSEVNIDISAWKASRNDAAEAESKTLDAPAPADEVLSVLAETPRYYEVKVMVQADSFAEVVAVLAEGVTEDQILEISR